VLDWLKNFHTDDWPNILEYCYLQKWIEEKTSVFAPELPELMTLYKREMQQYMNACGTLQAQEQIAVRSEKLKETGSAYKALHKNIQQNKGIEKLNWRYFFENNGPYWGIFFDIIITNGDTFEDLHPGIFTHLFYIDHKDINTEVLHLGKTIHTYFYNNDISDSTCDLVVKSEKIHASTKLNRPSVEMLKNARALAGNFYAVRQKFAIFQTKSANIISCLHPVLNMHLLSHFRDAGIKELYIDDNPAERLVECLIETKKKSFLLIQDFTLHPGDTNTLASQIRVVEDFEKMAFIIHNLESVKLTEDFQEAIQVYFDVLK
jgi:hypothetical protein